MSKELYIKYIEKSASAKDLIMNTLAKNKKELAMFGGGATALGGAYLLSSKEDKEKIKDLINKQKEFNNNHKLTKALLRSGGALTGTALAIRGGKPLEKAIGDGGIAGTAVGDLIGSSVLPVKDLYSKHKKEFGTSPDAKSVVKVLGANALPSAALWGGIYGIKHGAIKKNLSKKMSDGVNNAINGKKELAEIFNKYNGKPELIKEVGEDVLQAELKDKFKKIIEGGATIPMTMMTPSIVRKNVVSIPGALITPDSVIKKKKEIESKTISKEQ